MNGIELLEFFVRAFAGVFVIIDPIGGSTHFLALSAHVSSSKRKDIAKRACLVALCILVFFTLAGGALLKYFGITLAALKIAGGILLFTIAITMLYGKPAAARISQEEEEEAPTLDDIAVIPLAIPLLSGPGAITTVMVFVGEAKTPIRIGILLFTIFLSLLITYVIFVHSEYIKNALKRTGIKIMTRIMGLIMSVIAVQFVINGIADIIPFLLLRIK